MTRALGMLLGLALLSPTPVSSGPDKPRLKLRTLQRVAFSPVSVFVVAELVGGTDGEELYCPGLVWEWGDGTRSAHEADCPPFMAGDEPQRHFTARHVYREAGQHRVRLILRKATRSVVSGSMRIMIRSRFGN